MSCGIFIFDACSLINLFHIDEDNLLYNEILRHNIYIAEEVINEVKKNALKKFYLLDAYRISYDNDKKDEINIKIASLIRFKVLNKEIENECGSLFGENKRFNNYYKYNGEFISSCLALIKSREQNHLTHFYTDDYPATMKLKDYYNYQKIGFIQDSVDLLIYLYWTSSKISLRNLKDFLSLLLYEYNIELKLLLEQIRNRKESIRKITKDKKLIILLEKLEKMFSTFTFNGLNKTRLEILNYRKKIPDFCKTLDSFPRIYEIENENENDINLLSKIRKSIDWLNTYEILKIN